MNLIEFEINMRRLGEFGSTSVQLCDDDSIFLDRYQIKLVRSLSNDLHKLASPRQGKFLLNRLAIDIHRAPKSDVVYSFSQKKKPWQSEPSSVS